MVEQVSFGGHHATVGPTALGLRVGLGRASLVGRHKSVRVLVISITETLTPDITPRLTASLAARYEGVRVGERWGLLCEGLYVHHVEHEGGVFEGGAVGCGEAAMWDMVHQP